MNGWSEILNRDLQQKMTDRFFEIDAIVLKLGESPIKPRSELLRLINRDANICDDYQTSETGQLQLRGSVCYARLCRLLSDCLREKIREECVAIGIPVPHLEPDGAICVALYHYTQSYASEKNPQERQQHRHYACEWFQRAMVGEYRNIACAGFICTLFDYDFDDESDDSKWVFRTIMTCGAVSADVAAYAISFYQKALSNRESFHQSFVKFASTSVYNFLLALCIMSRNNFISLFSFRYGIAESLKKIDLFCPYMANMCLAWIKIENYQHCNLYKVDSLDSIGLAAQCYKKPHWLHLAQTKCEDHEKMATAHFERCEQKEKRRKLCTDREIEND